MNAEDLKFVEGIKSGMSKGSEFLPEPLLSFKNSQRLIAIIEKQSLALEKCKEQRDAVCVDQMHLLHELGTDYRADWTIKLFNDYLDEILK